MRSLGKNVTDVEIGEMLKGLDLDGSGFISFTEFIIIMHGNAAVRFCILSFGDFEFNWFRVRHLKIHSFTSVRYCPSQVKHCNLTQKFHNLAQFLYWRVQ